MIIEVDTSLLEKIGNLNIDQLVFLSLLLNENQTFNQDIQNLISLVPDEDIADLNRRDLIVTTHTNDSISYDLSDTSKALLKEKDWFDEFYEQFPVYITRPDGSRDYLRTNVQKCRQQYKKIVGRSKAMHEHLLKALQYDLTKRMTNGNLSYMKSMWKWLTQCEWENYDEELKYESNQVKAKNYGTDII